MMTTSIFLYILLLVAVWWGAKAYSSFVIKQRTLTNGTLQLYAPYILWDNHIEPNTPELTHPLSLVSIEGILDITLSVQAKIISTSLFTFTTRVFCYNDVCKVPGPTLYIKPGDRLRIRLENQLEYSHNGANRTNLFFQNLPIDINQNSPLFSIEGGETHVYDYTIPLSTPPGLHWYHSRVNGLSAMQVMGGLVGGLVILPNVDLPPNFSAVKSHVLFLTHMFMSRNTSELAPGVRFGLIDEHPPQSSLTYPTLSTYAKSTLSPNPTILTLPSSAKVTDAWLVNGQYQPTLRCQPNEWRLLNIIAGAGDRILELSIEGTGASDGLACEMRLFGKNGFYLRSTRTVQSVVLLQSERAMLAFRCAAQGSYSLSSNGSTDFSSSSTLGSYQTKTIQHLLQIEVSGDAYVMANPPADLSFLAPTSPPPPPNPTNSSPPRVSLSLSQISPRYCAGPDVLVGYGIQPPPPPAGFGGQEDLQQVLGVGVGVGQDGREGGCRPPCFDAPLCMALYGGEYSIRDFPAQRSSQCQSLSYSAAAPPAPVQYGVSQGQLDLDIWGSRDFPHPLFLQAWGGNTEAPGDAPQGALGWSGWQLRGFDPLPPPAVPLLLFKDRYAPLYDPAQVYALYGAALGDVSEVWPGFVGRGRYTWYLGYEGLGRAVKQRILTPYLQFEDRGLWGEVLLSPAADPSAPVPAPTAPPVATPSPPTLAPTSPFPSLHPADAAAAPLLCDAAGSSAAYSEEILAARGVRVITTSSCPAHFHNCQAEGCGGDDKVRALRIVRKVTVPLYPRIRLVPRDATCLRGGVVGGDAARGEGLAAGGVGVALNGVGIYSPAEVGGDGGEGLDGVEGECLSTDEYASVVYRHNPPPSPQLPHSPPLTPLTPSPRRNFSQLVWGREDCNMGDGKGKFRGIRYCGDIMQKIGNSLDKCGGYGNYEDQGRGEYRYYTLPTCLHNQLLSNAANNSTPSTSANSKHSPQVGWALDGFPIYGPRGWRGIRMLPCSHPQAHPVICLDACNGYYGAITGVDEYMYRYYLPVIEEERIGVSNTDDRSLNTSCTSITPYYGGCARNDQKCCSALSPPKSLYPYTLGCLRGCVVGEEIRENGPESYGVCAVGGVKGGARGGVTGRFIPSISKHAISGVRDEASYVNIPPPSATPTPSPSLPSPTVPPPTSVVSPTPSPTPFPTLSVLVQEPRERKMRMYEVSAEGLSADGEGISTRSFPASDQDVLINSIAYDAGRDGVFYTTEREIMYLSLSSRETLPLVSSLVEVHIYGFNLPKQKSDIQRIFFAGEECTSIVVTDDTYLRCLCISKEVGVGDTSYVQTYFNLSPEDILAGAIGLSASSYGAIPIEIHHTHGVIRGLHPQAYINSMTRSPTISHIRLNPLSFQPHCVMYMQGYLYWGLVGRTYTENTERTYTYNALMRGQVVNTAGQGGLKVVEVETVAHNIPYIESLEGLSGYAQRHTLAFFPAPLDPTEPSSPPICAPSVTLPTHFPVAGDEDEDCLVPAHLLFVLDAQTQVISKYLFPLQQTDSLFLTSPPIPSAPITSPSDLLLALAQEREERADPAHYDFLDQVPGYVPGTAYALLPAQRNSVGGVILTVTYPLSQLLVRGVVQGTRVVCGGTSHLYVIAGEGLVLRYPLSPLLTYWNSAQNPNPPLPTSSCENMGAFPVFLPSPADTLLRTQAPCAPWEVAAAHSSSSRLGDVLVLPSRTDSQGRSFRELLLTVDQASSTLHARPLSTLYELPLSLALTPLQLQLPGRLALRRVREDGAGLVAELLVAELLGRLWTVQIGWKGGYGGEGVVDFRPSQQPQLVLDASTFTASVQIRSLLQQAREEGRQRVFFEPHILTAI